MTEWSFTAENCGKNCPKALRTRSMNLYVDCEIQLFATKAEKTPQAAITVCRGLVVPLGHFKANAERIFSDALAKIPKNLADSESLDKEGLCRLALSLVSTEVPLVVHLMAATVMPSDEIERTRRALMSRVASFTWVEVQDEDECCAICLEKMAGTRAMQMECKHIFHKACIEKWRFSGRSCPMCRSVLWKQSEL